MTGMLQRLLSAARIRAARTSLLALLLGSPAFAAVTDLATAPLETSTGTLVKPNILYVLDNSGSMVWDFMPDWAGDYDDDWLLRNSNFNGVYYDSATTYTPPLTYSGGSYLSMTSANTSAWTRVPYDGYGVMNTGNIPNTGVSNLFTSSGSGGTQDLTGATYPSRYYTFVAGEYCSAPNLRNCVTQNAPTTANPYPAILRWCTTAALTNCQASRIDSSTAPATYTFPRYPGMNPTATVTVSGLALGAIISGITVGGAQILSTPTSTLLSSTANVAASLAAGINACTNVATGNCTVSGYSATRTGSTITITSGGNNADGLTPVVTRGALLLTTTATAFSSSTPGRFVRTNISSATSTYLYPGTAARATARTDCANTAYCTYAEEMTNYANWWAYYRTRMQTMKSATSIAFGAISSSYRLGYMSINDNSATIDFLNVGDNTTEPDGQKDLWYRRLTTALPSGGTPLRTALSQAGRYYAGKLSSINGVTAGDPMQYACQRNYTLLSTDGYWNEAATPVQVSGTAIGDRDSGEARPYFDGSATSNSLADVAQYYYATDIRSTDLGNATNASGTDVSSNAYSNRYQNMVTSTIGLGASGYMLYDPDYANATGGDYFDVATGTATNSTTQSSGLCIWQNSGLCNWPAPRSNTQTTIDDLWHAAVNGRGTYYSAANAADIRAGLTNFLNTVDATTSSSAAVAQSAPVLTATTTGYTFSTTFCSGKWFGELARYQVNAATGATAATADWSQSGAGTDCQSNTGGLTTTPLLDSKVYTTRNIFTFDATARTQVPFAWDSLTATMQNYFKIAAVSGISQLCSSGSNCLPSTSQVNSTTAGTTTGAGGVNLVNYLRGDRSNEGSTTARYYRPRAHVLGDIVNSTPVYIQAPVRNYTDTGYTAYKTANVARQGMVYVGANDGMLHAFNADTGNEVWSYIPSVLLPNLYTLADKNYAANHRYFVDGPITQADVYYGGSWKTILVGGLGGGGRAFFAVDVTNPASPRVLWEFSSSSALTPNLNDADLGYSYGAPIVTKLSDGTWAIIVSSGYNNLSNGDGRGHLWVLNAATGAIIKKLDNGMGTMAGGGTVVGCAVAPCPSGLAQISAWTDSVTDNSASQVYGGDLFGNLWRFDVGALNSAGGSATVKLLATLSDAVGTRQPITTTPELGLVGGKHIVFVGTGAYLGVPDVTSTQTQTMYAIRDPLDKVDDIIYPNPRTNVCATSTGRDCFARVTLADVSGVRTAVSAVTPSLSTMAGWFADMPSAGERIDVDPVLYSGTLVYVSNRPGTTGACSVGGVSYINYVNYATGLAVTGVNNVGVLLSDAGVSSAAVLANTSTNRIVATTKNSAGVPSLTTIPTATAPGGSRRISWRRLRN